MVALEPVRHIGAHGKNFTFDFMPEHAGQLARVGRQGLASTKVELSFPHVQLTVTHARVLGANQHLRPGRHRKRVLGHFVGFAVSAPLSKNLDQQTAQCTQNSNAKLVSGRENSS